MNGLSSSQVDPNGAPAVVGNPTDDAHVAKVLLAVEQLIETETQPDSFYQKLVSLVIEAVRASSGKLWQGGSGHADLVVHSAADFERQASLHEKEHAMAASVFQNSNAHWSWTDTNAEAPTHQRRCCLMAPITDHSGCFAVVSLITYVQDDRQALAQLHLVANCMKRVRQHFLLRHYENVAQEYGELTKAHHVCQGVSQTIETKPLAFEVVGRLQHYFDVERVTLAFRRGKKCKIQAISNQAVFDVRSSVVKHLEKLASKSAEIEEQLWYPNDLVEDSASPDSTNPLAPSIRESLERYLEASNTTSIGLLPLYAQPKRRDDPKDIAATIRDDSQRKECVGVLIVEGMQDAFDVQPLTRKLARVENSVSNAVANARTYDGLFMMPVWRKLGMMADWYRGHTRRKALLITAAILIPILSLFLTSAEFKLRGDGVIQPMHRQHVYAETTGTVDQLFIVDGQSVQENTPILQLKNPELAAQIAEVEGRLRESKKQLETVTFQRVSRSYNGEQEQRELVRTAASTQARIEGLTKQLALLQDSFSKLSVNSPIAGEVVTWDTRQRLQDRPIERGERLITIALPTGPWEVELRIPDKRAGYLLRQWYDPTREGALPVTFVLASESTEVYRGEVFEVAPSSNVDDKDNENVVRVRVRLGQEEFDKMQSVKPGTSVIGHVHCGRTSLGYSKLYEFVDWTRRMWFKFIG